MKSPLACLSTPTMAGPASPPRLPTALTRARPAAAPVPVRVARRADEGYGGNLANGIEQVTDDQALRDRATVASAFDPAELPHGHRSETLPPASLAALPLIVVVGVNFLMSIVVLPRLDTTFLAEERWGGTSLAGVGGIWAVVVALAAAILILVLTNLKRLPALARA